MIQYLSNLSNGKIVLWCYLIWYCVTVLFYFDPSIYIWLNSAGISAVIGVALILSVAKPAGRKPDHWQTFRLFMMPFAVSSFSSLIKGQGFILIFPGDATELAVYFAACAVFIGVVCLIKHSARERVDA